MKNIQVNQFIFNVQQHVLGSQSHRAVLWMQGCSIGCRGCTSPHTWSSSSGYTIEVEDIISELKQRHASGLTITGGEPTEQPEALLHLCQLIRDEFGPGFELVLYSGLNMDAAQALLPEVFGLIDVGVFGPYEKALPATPLSGSNNQQVYMNPYSHFVHDYQDWEQWPMHRLQVYPLNETEYLIVGIPNRNAVNHAVKETKLIFKSNV